MEAMVVATVVLPLVSVTVAASPPAPLMVPDIVYPPVPLRATV
jgi:hypothetical protein